jgi:hypothetical protein
MSSEFAVWLSVERDVRQLGRFAQRLKGQPDEVVFAIAAPSGDVKKNRPCESLLAFSSMSALFQHLFRMRAYTEARLGLKVLMKKFVQLLVSVCFVLSCASPALAVTSLRYAVVDLGIIDPTQPSTIGVAINRSGIIVGNANVGGARHPFYWDGRLHDIGTFGGPSGFAVDINDVGAIVGWADPGPDLFVLKNGSKVDLGIPDNAFNFLSAYINDEDVILAYPIGDNLCDTSNLPFVVHLRVSRARLPLRLFCQSNVFGIDNRGEVLGYLQSRFTYGFLDSFGHDFDPLGSRANGFVAGSVNRETDDVIGEIPARSDQYGAYYIPATNTLVRLPSLSQVFTTSLTLGVNRRGQIVGTACRSTVQCDGGNIAFLFDPSIGMVNLNNVAHLPAGYSSYLATAINDEGQIVVVAVKPPSGPDHTFLLTPSR